MFSCVFKAHQTVAGCEAKIRKIAPALHFALEHSMPAISDLGATSAKSATQICERDPVVGFV